MTDLEIREVEQRIATMVAESQKLVAEAAHFKVSTIVAPFIENDIRGRDCEGNNVSEALDIPPTDQTLSLTTGQP